MDIFDKALCYATEKHSGQVRKGSNTPYIVHSVEVAGIIASMSDDKELLAAALLHDTVEDTDATIEEIRELFGEKVSSLVLTETEDKHKGQSPEQTWVIRKEESLAKLENTEDINVKMLWMADKLSNMRFIANSCRTEGSALWNCFHQKDPKMHAWYYVRIAKSLSELQNYPAYQEYVSLVKLVFKDYLGDFDYEI